MTLIDPNLQPPLPVSPEPRAAPPSSKRDTAGLLLFIYHITAVGIMFGGAVVMILSSIVQRMGITIPGVKESAFLPSVMLAAALALCGALLIPATVQAARRMAGKPDAPVTLQPIRVRSAVALIILWFVVAGSAQLFESAMNWMILPPFLILGVGLPIYLLFRIGVAGLSVDSRQRAWNVFGVGLVAGPALAGVAELLVYFILLFAAGIFVMANPEWESIFLRIGEQLKNASSMDQILTVVGPYLISPGAIIVMLLVVSVAIPIIEETVKPVGVWLLKKRPPTPQEGFVLGVLSGAGFALLESAVALASTESSWGVAFFARIGGGIMHMMNTGLMGWAIASFWRERKFLRLAGVYGLVIFTHGLWNALTIMVVVGGLRVALSSSGTDALGAMMTLVSVLGLLAMATGGLIALILLNLRMRRNSIQDLNPQPGQPDIKYPERV